MAPTWKNRHLVVFRKSWNSSHPQQQSFERLVVKLPPYILYQQGFFNRDILETENLRVCGRLVYHNSYNESGTPQEYIRSCKVLRIAPLSERPNKPQTECPSWSALMLWQTERKRLRQCPQESETIQLLKFPLASTGERFGLMRSLPPFQNRALERTRRQAVKQPRATFSVWIYLLKFCQKLCGIIHHVGRSNQYESVLMQLTDTGDIIIQARLTTEEDEALRAAVALPLRKWIRLDAYIQNSKVLMQSTWGGVTQRFIYQFRNNLRFDDTDGYFVFGGSKYMPGIAGYFGPAKYYRRGTPEVNNPLPAGSIFAELEKFHHECQEANSFAASFVKEVSDRYLFSPLKQGVCASHVKRPWGHFGERMSKQTWSWESQEKYRTLFKFLQSKLEATRAGAFGLGKIGSALFNEAVLKMVTGSQVNITSEVKFLLQASSCSGHHKASLLLAALHLSGMGHPVLQQKGHVYSLVGAVADNRFALMHAGYKHALGLDGFPQDLDMAYSYYSNVGEQSSSDVSTMHKNKQSALEHVYLSDYDELNNRETRNNDVYHFLKYKAMRGDVESQKKLGTMLYWGQHGVSKDIGNAVKWFEKCAMQMTDSSALYEYAMLLIKGLGVKKNITQGLQLLEKAAAMGSISALNGLGWYHGNILKDHKTAEQYFEQAALNGSGDGMFNLGVYYLTGLNPESAQRNEAAAFQLFLSASRSGHVGAAVEAAWYLSTGSLEGVSRDVKRAVMMLKEVCEGNGHLGFLVREALQKYLHGSRQTALVMYALAAETGLGLAQSNVAHLCQELDLGRACELRYLNYSVLHYSPTPSALLKMGDYYYYHPPGSQEESLSSLGQALSMYIRAALAGSPQGMFNLAVMVEKGHVLPKKIYNWFNTSFLEERETVVETILQRCVESEDIEAACALSLLRVQMEKAWRRMSQNSAQIILSCEQTKGLMESKHDAVALRASTVSQDLITDGITRGTIRARGNLRTAVTNVHRRLQCITELAVTLSGVCLCACGTTLAYQLL
ncbi:protein sel-1 homolog 3-like [Synchiropus splendidus]|uniref:protein sel-1 homolog 3-like n=1 Tax=Synchiropus splendidus TaxID=270530 RepID=UPI00237EB832|nr:protein sel-1 homolog 3-like [Synchiropus splendidus]